MQTLWNVRVTQQRPKSAKKRHFYGWRKNTHINELACVISDDFYVFFRVVKHSKKILADNQLFTGLRDGSPGLSWYPPSALRSASEIVSSSKRYMQEDGRYWGRRAWANSTRSIAFDSSIEAPLWLWDAFIYWARCCRNVQKFGVLKNTYISKLADEITGEFWEKSPKFLFWNLLIADIQSSKRF